MTWALYITGIIAAMNLSVVVFGWQLSRYRASLSRPSAASVTRLEPRFAAVAK